MIKRMLGNPAGTKAQPNSGQTQAHILKSESLVKEKLNLQDQTQHITH